MSWIRMVSSALAAVGLLIHFLAPVRVSAGPVTGTLSRNETVLQGQSLELLPLLFAPPVVQPGSTLSHWDTTATPNLLMEPNISADLAFGALDITPLLLQDIGWEFGEATINILDGDEMGNGFTDPRPFPGAPGNDATTLGEARQNLIGALLDSWASTLESSVAIDILVFWQPLPCSPAGAALAGATATDIFQRDDLPEERTWYPSALAEALVGENLTGDPAGDGGPDIMIVFNSDIDEECLGEGTGYYYGLDGEEPENLVDLAPVTVHEIAHGLGFANFTDERTGEFLQNTPSIYDHFTLDEILGRTWVRMSADERAFSATNDKNVSWIGENAIVGSDAILDPGTPLLEVGGEALFVGAGTFGAPIDEQGVTGELACAFDEAVTDFEEDLPSIRDGCNTLSNPQDLDGKFAIVDRGNCTFETKALNAEAAGATGLLIINNNRNPFLLNPGGPDDSPVAIPVAGLNAAQGDFLRSMACPVMPPPDLVFAQWVNGESEGVENGVRVILRNRGLGVETGTISFLSPMGELISPAGEMAIEPIPYTIDGLGTFEFQTSGTGPLQNGVIEVRSDGPDNAQISGSEIFELLGSFVSVPNSSLRTRHTIYVSVDETENTGMAIYNAHPELWIRVNLALSDSDGSFVDDVTIDLEPRRQVIGFVDEEDFFSEALADFPQGFKGTLSAFVLDGPDFSMLGLIQKSGGELIATETLSEE